MKKIVFCGASLRGLRGFAKRLLANYTGKYEIAGLFDIDPGKMKGFCELLGKEVPQFTDFDKMLDDINPDEMFISTTDVTHAEYLVRAINRNVDCICEKPLCINAEQCGGIIAALKENPSVSVFTAHNLRYVPAILKIRELLESGTIGTIRSITFSEMLDRRHGKSYFRRWNSRKEISGGLLIHKSSHHFDLINWLIGAKPAKVIAQGRLIAYGSESSPYHGENCRDCEFSEKCPDYIDCRKDETRDSLFYKHMLPDSYTPDLCIYSPEINIEDQATVGIVYENGAGVSYSLNAHSSIAGYNIYIEGKSGTLEYFTRHDSSGKANPENFQNSLKVWRMDGECETINVPKIDGGHGGADPLILNDLFGGDRRKNKNLATLMDGIQAVLVGAAANISLETGKEVDVQSLIV
jgi:predicted dehydrogenase